MGKMQTGLVKKNCQVVERGRTEKKGGGPDETSRIFGGQATISKTSPTVWRCGGIGLKKNQRKKKRTIRGVWGTR